LNFVTHWESEVKVSMRDVMGVGQSPSVDVDISTLLMLKSEATIDCRDLSYSEVI
jgi:hypothetical protein